MTQGAIDPQQWIADHTRRVGEIGERAQAAQEQISTTRGAAEGAGGAVRVEVGPGGRLERLRLDQRAVQLGPEELARVIVETTRAAHHATVAQVQQALVGLVGEHSPAMDFVRELADTAVLADDQAHGTAGAVPPPDRVAPDRAVPGDGDDYFDGPVLR